jgi:hypothetical protein
MQTVLAVHEIRSQVLNKFRIMMFLLFQLHKDNKKEAALFLKELIRGVPLVCV